MAMVKMTKAKAIEIVGQILHATKLYGAHAKIPYNMSDVTAALALLHEEGSIALTPEQEDITKAHRQYAALNARFAKLQKAYDELKGAQA